MEPRAYSPAPTGTQFVVLSYGYQSGDVLLDSSLPLKRRKHKPQRRRECGYRGNATLYSGGSNDLNDTVNEDRQKNACIGATFSYPLNQRQSLKIVWAKGVTTHIGGNLNTIAVAWQHTWSNESPLTALSILRVEN